MVVRYIKVYPYLQSLVMCGGKFKMTKTEIAEGYGNFSNMAKWPTEFEKVPCNLNFSQISQVFPLASLEFIK